MKELLRDTEDVGVKIANHSGPPQEPVSPLTIVSVPSPPRPAHPTDP